MGARQKLMMMVGGLGLYAITTCGALAAPDVITLDGKVLEATRARIKQNDVALKPALDALIGRADKALAGQPEAVTQKGLTPPSGDKHDYMSIGPYWWPDPSKPNGLPYMRKDGETNPSSKNDDTDSARIQRMCEKVKNLALAYYFTGKPAYAEKTAEAIRTWFLDASTRMNPNLRYGQAVPGVTDGRGIGLIDTRNFWMVIDAAGLIKDSGRLSDQDIAGLKTWFADFTKWMVESPQGREEFTWHNNHGTFYDAQIVNYALFAGEKDLAARTLNDAIHLRMAAQIAKDGKQYAELERTRPYHYSAFNLEAHLKLARYGELADVDYWNTVQDGRTLKAGVDFLAGYLVDPKSWPFKDLDGVKPDPMLPILLQGARGWPDRKAAYFKAFEAVPTELKADEAALLWAIEP
jgi:hypothetical protein